MQTKKKIILFGFVVVFTLACFLGISNASIGTPDNVNIADLDLPNSSGATNLDILNDIFDAKNSFYSTHGYFKQLYSGSIQATFYALYVLEAIGKLNEVNQEELKDYILSFYDPVSGFFADENSLRYLGSKIPGRHLALSSVLEVYCYAALSLEVLDSLDLLDINDAIDFVWSCYHPTLHGFIGQPYDASLSEGFKIPTADNTYYAVITLTALGIDWDQFSQERGEIASYVDTLQSQGSWTGFNNDGDFFFDSLVEMEPNQFSSYYCVKTLESFGSGYLDIIDTPKFHQDLETLYHPEEHYFDLSTSIWAINYSNIVATAINLELADITGFTNFNRPKVIEFITNNRNYRGGWESSTTISYHELIDTFQIVRSLVKVGGISELSVSDKNEISSFVKLFSQEKGYSLLSEDYTSVDLIYSTISSYEYFDRVGELDIQALYNLLFGTYEETGVRSSFFACTNMNTERAGFRSNPFDYYTVGYQDFVEEINPLSSNKEAFKVLESLKKIYKLNDFTATYGLEATLQDVIDSQFLDPFYTENFGAFLVHNDNLSSHYRNDHIFVEYSYYAVRAIEIIAEHLSLGSINGVFFANLGFDRNALTTYIARNMVETSSVLYFDVDYSDSIELSLENLYYAIYVLKALDQFSLDTSKIENFVTQSLNYSNVRNLYFSYKISEIADLSIFFDLEATHSLIQSIYSVAANEFYVTTDKKVIDQEAFLWVCEMAKQDQVRINARFSEPIVLGGNAFISVELANIILFDFGQYATVKFESAQLGTIVLDQGDNHTFQKSFQVPINSNNFPSIDGNICAYDGSLKVAEMPVSLSTTFETIYSVYISKTESRIKIIANASLRFASGQEAVFDGFMYANVYREGEFLDAIEFEYAHELDCTEFTLTYRPSYSGIYKFAVYMEDPYHPIPDFVVETSYTFTGAGPKPGEQPIEGYEVEAILTFPLIVGLVGAPSTAYIGITKKGLLKKTKNKLKMIKTT